MFCGKRLRENNWTSEPFLNASIRIPSSFRSKIHSGPVKRSCVSVAAIGTTHSGKAVVSSFGIQVRVRTLSEITHCEEFNRAIRGHRGGGHPLVKKRNSHKNAQKVQDDLSCAFCASLWLQNDGVFYQLSIRMRNRVTPPEIAPNVAPFLPPAIAPTAVAIPAVAAIINASCCQD